MSSVLLPVWVQIYLPLGVLDDEARAQYVAAVHQAISTALPNETRHIASSCIINEVAEGTWGVNGMIWSLPDFAKQINPARVANISRGRACK
jgi:phenylpyruvate tautomerase PptA (4-oxalocrotonate tautomerase family)